VEKKGDHGKENQDGEGGRRFQGNQGLGGGTPADGKRREHGLPKGKIRRGGNGGDYREKGDNSLLGGDLGGTDNFLG